MAATEAVTGRLAAPAGSGTSPQLTQVLRALALPTFGLAFAISVLTTYGPVVLRRLTSSRLEIGFAVGGEGLFALFLPVLVGSLSDRLRPGRLGRRLPFVLAGAPLIALSLALLPFSGSYAAAVAIVFVFFVGYFAYYPPYRALAAEIVPTSHYGRAQGGQGLARGLGLGAALLAGGLLLSTWTPLPFLIAAAAMIASTGLLVAVVRPPGMNGAGSAAKLEGIGSLLSAHPELRAFALANALWEFSFAGLKTFIVLYVVQGLGRSTGIASAVIAVVAVAYIVAAPVAGRLADRIGLFRVLRAALWIYGPGLVLAAIAHSLWPLLIGLPVVALAGAVLMTLPNALLYTLAPAGRAGAVAGIQDFSRGLGVVTGPIVVGAAIDLARPLFPATGGYAALWLAIGIPILISLSLLRAIEHGGTTEARPLEVPC